MLNLMVAVGTRSGSGAELERALSTEYDIGTMEINPVSEHFYSQTSLTAIEARAKHFAERMKHDREAHLYVGVASGIAEVKIAVSGIVRMDVAVLMRHDKIETWYLNLEDAKWQAQEKILRLASPRESLTRLIIAIHKQLKTVEPQA